MIHKCRKNPCLSCVALDDHKPAVSSQVTAGLKKKWSGREKLHSGIVIYLWKAWSHLNTGLHNDMRTTPTSTFHCGTHWNKLQPPRSKLCGILITSLSCTCLKPTEKPPQYSPRLEVSQSFTQTLCPSLASSFWNTFSNLKSEGVHVCETVNAD